MTETIWAQASPTGASGYATTTEDGSYGLYFTVSANCTLEAIWFYSPSGASSLPTSIALYSTTSGSPGTGTLIVQNSSPSWSGAAGSGWVRAAITPQSLSSGTDYVAQYYGASFKQGYIYTGALGGGAWLFPESSATYVTAPVTYGAGTYSNCPYLNSSNAYPSTSFGGTSVNWLLDVEVAPAATNANVTGVGAIVTITAGLGWVSATGESYRAFPSTNGPSAATSNSGDLTLGMMFEVTAGNMWFEGFWWWCCNTGQPATAVTLALWQCYEVDSWTGTLVPDTTVTSGTLTPGAWNWVPILTPQPLAIATSYVAAVGIPGTSFPDTPNSFGSGDTYAAGITNGALNVFSATSGSNVEQWGKEGNCVYSSAGSDPAAYMPGEQFADNDNIWLDVQVAQGVPGGYASSYRIWPNNYFADAYTTTDSAVAYNIGTVFELNAGCTLDRIWFFSPLDTSYLPTECAVWSVATQETAASNTDPSWSAAAGSGWVSCAFSDTSLEPGVYIVACYNANGADGSWGAKRFGYWGGGGDVPDGGPQITDAGIVSGPIFCPSTANSPYYAYEYDSDGSGNTPPYSYSNGVQERGQSVFAQSGSAAFPQLYVDGGYQNYWVDVEVTPSSADLTGAGAVVAVAGGTGSVTTTANVNVGGAGAVVTAAGGTGSVTTTANVDVTGAAAAVTVGDGSGVPSAGADITGAAAVVTVAAGTGTPYGGGTGTVAGVAAVVTVTAGTGTPGFSSDIAGTAAVVTIAGGIGTPSGSLSPDASISGVGAAVIAVAGIGKLSAAIANAASVATVTQRNASVAAVTQRATSASSVSGG